MKVSRKAISTVVEAVLELGARRATKFISPRDVVKATRRHKPDKRSNSTEVVVTIGRPNYAEREFIKRCRNANEPFPVRKLQLKWYK